MQLPEFEIRSAPFKAEGNTVFGTAIVYDKPSIPLPFIETIQQGAATEFLRSNPTVLALYNHDLSAVLAKFPTNMKLWEDKAGVNYSFELPATTLGNDCRSLLSSGVLNAASFKIHVPQGAESWSTKNGVTSRSVSKISFPEISLVIVPAYPDATANLRSYQQHINNTLNKNNSETLRRLIATWKF